MRNSGWIVLITFVILCNTIKGQDEVQLKVNSKASEAARYNTPQNHTKSDSVSVNRPPATKSIFHQDQPIAVASWDGGQMTNLEVSATLSMRRPGDMAKVNPASVANSDKRQQVNIIKKLAWEKILLEKAKAAGITVNTPEVQAPLAAQEEALLNRLYYQAQIIPALNENTVKTAQHYYDANKAELFTKPAELIIRALHISTYEMITAEEGDTLKELAVKISGDADAASQIIEAIPPFYLRSVPSELDDKVLSSPLKAGEVLYVPLGKDAVTSATKFAEELRQKLLAGQSIDEVKAATTDADFTVSATQPVRLSTTIGYWDELNAAAKQLDQTSVSEVVKTPNGLNILVLADTTTTNVTPFSTVKDELIGRVVTDENQKRDTVERTRKEVLDHLWKKYNVQINRNAVSRVNYAGSDPLSTGTAIATIGDFQYTLEQFLNDLRVTGKTWGQLSEDERLDILKVAPQITDHLTAREAKSLGLQNSEEFKSSLQGFADALIVKEYRKRSADINSNRVSEDQLRAYYTDNIDNYTSAAQVTIREIGKRINMTLTPAARSESIENAKKSLNEIRSRIKSQEDFAQLARRESEAISTRSRGGLIGTVSETFRGASFKNQLRQLKIGEISEPFMYGSEIMIIRLDSRTPPTVQPFEEVKRKVIKDFSATEPQKRVNSEMERDLEKANFQIKF